MVGTCLAGCLGSVTLSKDYHPDIFPGSMRKRHASAHHLVAFLGIHP